MQGSGANECNLIIKGHSILNVLKQYTSDGGVRENTFRHNALVLYGSFFSLLNGKQISFHHEYTHNPPPNISVLEERTFLAHAS